MSLPQYVRAARGVRFFAVVLVTALLPASALLAGCTSSQPTPPPPPGPVASPPVQAFTPGVAFAVTSSAFPPNGVIPTQYTCKGAGTPPPISWSGDMKGAPVVSVVVFDPDAPGGEFVHWVVYDLPSSVTSLSGAALPAGAKQAENSSGKVGWTAPCPPSGIHHYHFAVYAMSHPTGLKNGLAADDVRHVIASNAVAYGEVIGTVSG
ncbi:MAG: YbhB/YbcL family Raf kinase inhibitor-like protein [Micromonosporaceae bacterium]|nr:YbhB/YbcL family Raf kinase inhibitor-like protein [Micromonosporaceae bacterium]